MAKRDFIFSNGNLMSDLCFRSVSVLCLCVLFICVGSGKVSGQSLNVQGTTCTGVSVVLYIQPAYPCTTLTVYSASSWSLPGATSVSYNSNFTQVHATWNTAGTYTVGVNYNCSTGGSGSKTANIVVSQTVTPAVSLSLGGVTSVCQGSSIHCTTTPSNGGTSPGYLFYVDNTLVQNSTTSTYNTASTLTAGLHHIYVQLYSYNACASPQTANSSTLSFTVVGTPSVGIQVSSTSYCIGSTISLTANGTNITGSPTYTWKVNGVQLGSTTSTASFVASASSYAANSITLAVSGIGGGCGSTASASYATPLTGISVSVPNPPTVSSNICGTKTLSYNGSPPGGTLWYWQGLNSLGQDYTSSTATASTYSISSNGSNTYYIAARNSSGCWSAAAGVSVSVDIPAAPSGNSISRCESDAMNLTTLNPSYPNYRWYDAGNHLLYTGVTYNPVNLNNGSYSYRVTSLSVNGCESAGSATVSLTVGGPSCDNYMNWNENIVYTYADASDFTGQVAADNKVYSDGFGKSVQSQVLSLTNSQVLATEKIYDQLGNQTLTTLPAPISSGSFAYRYRFTTNSSGSKYSWTDFDVPQTNNLPGQVLNPVPVGINGPGTLGWYYSSNNADPNVAVTTFPYSRTYTPPGPDPITSKAAGPDIYHMGSGHEVENDKLLISSSDMAYLNYYYSLRSSYNSNPYYTSAGLFNIPVASNSIGSFTWLNTTNAPPASVSNFVFATCGTSGNPGFYPINNVISVTPGMVCNFLVNGYATGGGQVFLHVTDASGNDIQWGTTPLPSSYSSANVNMKFTVPAGVTGIKLGVQWQTPVLNATVFINSVSLTGATLSAVPPTSSAGYKMISTDQDGKKTATFVDGDGNTIASALITSAGGTFPNQTYAYDYWSYSFYNDAGQLIASIAPKGINTDGSAASGFVTTYTYDHLGRMISTTSPDDGTSQFVYSTDGKIRFSQNQEQRNAGNPRFSYTNYDYLGRLIESGEYTYTASGDFIFDAANVPVPSANSVLNIIDNTGYTGVTLSGNTTTADRYSDVSFIDYDVAPSDFVSDGIHTVQNNLTGMISHTKNSNATTWYSYDEFGQVEWTMQYIAGLQETKTIDYTYDFLGNVTQVAYQKGQAGTAGSESFFHHYSYDRDSRLINAATSLDGTTKTQRAAYSYYLHGPLKRVELGTGLQGIDYVYNITGTLKSINNVDIASDPGADGSNGFRADVFGMSLNYYDGDYTGAGGKSSQVSVPSITNTYSGNIKSQSWHSPVDNGIVRTYGYSYDPLNQLTNAQWGTVTGATNAYTAAFPTTTYNESVTSYDKNGNIAGLTRNGTAGTLANYTFGNGTTSNALSGVTNSVPSSAQCISCAQLQTQLSAYLSANPGADLSNIPPITSYINSALSKTFTDQQYQAAFKTCNLTSSYLYDYFNGYVTFGQQPQYHIGTGDFSIESWVNLSNGYYAMPVLTNEKLLDCNPNISGFLLQILNGSVQFIYADGTFYGRGSYTINTLSTGAWHHLVATRTGSSIAIYFDGVLQPLVDFSYQLYTGDIDANGTTDMKIGKTVPDCGGQAGFIGGLRQVRLYRRLLTSSEVSANYNAGLLADPSNQNSLVLWAPLDDGSGNTVKDKSPYAHSGTFAGSDLYWETEPSPSGNVKPIAQILCPDGTEPSTQTSQNSIGQVTQETTGTNTLNISYNAYGLTKEVRDGNNNLTESFTYDDRGAQLSKTYYTNGTPSQVVYYITDIAGNLISTYEQPLPSGAVSQTDVPIYCTGRIGIYKANTGKTLYEIDDHLGNVRAVILPSEYTETKTATFEPSLSATDQSNFLRYQNAQFVNASLFDHTQYFTPVLPSGTTTPSPSSYSQRLNGSGNEMYGLARSINVMPGDQVNAEVYAKYVDPVSSNWNAGLINLMSQITSMTPGVVIDGAAITTSTMSFPFAGAGVFSDNETGPQAYLAWLIFDKNFNLLSYGADQMTQAAKEDGTNVPHERLVSPLITITQPGYVYFYLVNENPTPVDVYFDDFSVTHHHSILAAGGDYYPFGLPIADRQLDAEGYRFGYQGQYAERDSITQTNNFQLRMYEPKFGRWLSPDPYGQFNSPYMAMANNPVSGIDVDGGWFSIFNLEGAAIGTALGLGVGLATDPKHWYEYALGGAVAGGFLTSDFAKVDIWGTHSASGLQPLDNGREIIRPISSGSSHDIFDFTQFNSDPNGLDITLLYRKRVPSGLNNYRWIQTIRTNAPKNHARPPYNDPQPPDDAKPFYWTDLEEKTLGKGQQTGQTARFSDGPRRVVRNKTIHWQAELSLVGKRGNSYFEVRTWRYGFTLDSDGTVTLHPPRARKPSAFQRATINSAR